MIDVYRCFVWNLRWNNSTEHMNRAMMDVVDVRIVNVLQRSIVFVDCSFIS